MLKILTLIPLSPLFGALISGLSGRLLSRQWGHRITIFGVFVSFSLSVYLMTQVLAGYAADINLYTWLVTGNYQFSIGFKVDFLSALMCIVVTFVSLMVHVYTIGYMHEDPGYKRFFSYIALFTFSMLMLVLSNNFVQLFFGWEAVGLVSYLLIGFWYNKPSAVHANFKAFIVNRIGDFGFILAIGLIAVHANTLHFGEVFSQADTLAVQIVPVTDWPLITAICITLFIGAMGKSAQFPLHVWLPDSMEGPTPISALIHAATMVTAGIFMVARMSPLFELSATARSFVLIIGAITALFMALVAIVQTDIKRVIAFSTLSQLGYMTAALGVSAYGAAIFHLMTHAFFKAVLFLGAGSVIIAMHHEQDMRKMGGLRKYLPITYFTFLIGAWANSGLPPFSGFYSKDIIIESVNHASAWNQFGASFAYYSLLLGALVGGFYSFRLVFFTFHGEERFKSITHHDNDKHHHGVSEPKESPWVVTIPLILLAIPSVFSGWFIGSLLFGEWFNGVIFVNPNHDVIKLLSEHFHGVFAMTMHGFVTPPFWLALSGFLLAFFLYTVKPKLPALIKARLAPFAFVLEKKYGLDEFNEWFFARGSRLLGKSLWQGGDQVVIDGTVNGLARLIGIGSQILRWIQSGRLYHYVGIMITASTLLLTYWLLVS